MRYTAGMSRRSLAACSVVGIAVFVTTACQPTAPAEAPVRAVVAPEPAGPEVAVAAEPESEAPVGPPWEGSFEREPERDGTLTLRGEESGSVTFELFVHGPNGHTGEVQGNAVVKGPRLAVFRGENGCELVFEVQDDAVEIRVNEWSHCTHYHGARCHLDGRFQRVIRP